MNDVIGIDYTSKPTEVLGCMSLCWLVYSAVLGQIPHMVKV